MPPSMIYSVPVMEAARGEAIARGDFIRKRDVKVSKVEVAATLLVGGMTRSSTMEVTIFPKAAPMITPTAKSTTLPQLMDALNSE